MSYVLLHKHGNVAPKGKSSYIKMATGKNKELLRKKAKSQRLGNYRIVPKSKVAKTKYSGLVYVKR